MKRLHYIAAALLLVVATTWPAAAKAGPAPDAAGSGSPLLAAVDVGVGAGQDLDVGADLAGVELALEAPRSWTYLDDLARFAEDAKWRLEVDVQSLAGGCVGPSQRLKTRVRGYQLFRGGNEAVKESLIPYAARDFDPSRTAGPMRGVFITTDPLGYVDGPNLYQFAGNNPVNNSDPMGLSWSLGPCGTKVGDAWHECMAERRARPKSSTEVFLDGFSQKMAGGLWNLFTLPKRLYDASQELDRQKRVRLQAHAAYGPGAYVFLHEQQTALNNKVVGESARNMIPGVCSFSEARQVIPAYESGNVLESGQHWGQAVFCSMGDATFAYGTVKGAQALGRQPATLGRSLATATDEAVFWSGLPEGRATSSAWAARNRGLTMEAKLRAEGVDIPAYDPSLPGVVAAWEEASARFAAGARGHVRVLQSDIVRAGTMWSRIEFPTLKANPDVLSITAIDPTTGAKALLWKK